MTSRVRVLTVRSFDVACAYANGGDAARLAPQAAALDDELAALLTRCPPHVAARCRVARHVLSHLLTAPECSVGAVEVTRAARVRHRSGA